MVIYIAVVIHYFQAIKPFIVFRIVCGIGFGRKTQFYKEFCLCID